MSDKQDCPPLRGLKELIALQTGKVSAYKAKLLDDGRVLKALCLRHLNTMGFYLPFTQCSFISPSLLFLSLNMNDRRLKVLWGGKYFWLAWLWKPDLINKMPCWELFSFPCHRKIRKINSKDLGTLRKCFQGLANIFNNVSEHCPSVGQGSTWLSIQYFLDLSFSIHTQIFPIPWPI